MAHLSAPSVTVDGDQDRLVHTLFISRALATGRTQGRTVSWRSESILDPKALATIASHAEETGSLECVLEIDEALVLVRIRRGEVRAQFAAVTPEALDRAEQTSRQLLPASTACDEKEIDAALWYRATYGVERESRRLTVPSWDDIAENYPQPTREQLGRLVEAPPTRASGRLLLWHGAPGTGKTYALRALGWEWREWCALHYIVDPEVLFGQDPAYLIDVITGDHDDRGRARLLVLEDTGELLSADARERAGQGLSRLLNLADGILGDGMRVFVLVTTNEPLRRLHEAVARPGRCAHEAEFQAFSEEEAEEWLAVQGAPSPERRGMTLAEMFARVQGARAGHERRQHVGFA